MNEYIEEFRKITNISPKSSEYYRFYNALYRNTKTLKSAKYDEVIKFVNKIERRNGKATIKDCYIDLLDYFEWTSIHLDMNAGMRQSIEKFKAEDQFLIMYSYLLSFKKKVESGKLKLYKIKDLDWIVKN
jgi:hypothetical protein